MDYQTHQQTITNFINSNLDFLQAIEQQSAIVDQIQPRAILIIGQSKKGLTTIFNWLTNKRMRGKSHLITYYQNIDTTNPTISNGFGQTTLFPNIAPSFSYDVSLIDMGPFQSEQLPSCIRQHFWSLIINKVQNFKLLLVLREIDFNQQCIKSIIYSFQCIFRMFKIDLNKQSSKQVCNQLKRSLSLIATSSHNPELLEEYILEARKFLYKLSKEDQTLHFISQCLEQIKQNYRFYSFRKATYDMFPQNNKTVRSELLSQQYGKFESLKNIQMNINQQKQKLFKILIRQYNINKLLRFTQIIYQLFSHFETSLQDNLKNIKQSKRCITTSNLIVAIDKWMDHKFMCIYLSSQVSNQSLYLKFNALLKLRNWIISKNKQLPQHPRTFSQLLKLLQNTMQQTFTCLDVFFQYQTQNQLLGQTKQVINKIFDKEGQQYESQNFTTIERVCFKYYHNLSAIFSQNFQEQWQLLIMQKFVCMFDQTFLFHDCKTLQMVVEFQQLLSLYKPKLIQKIFNDYSLKQITILFDKITLKILIYEADLVLRNGSRLGSILTNIRVLQFVRSLKNTVISLNQLENHFQRQTQLISLEMYQKNIFNKIYEAVVQKNKSQRSPIIVPSTPSPKRIQQMQQDECKWRELMKALKVILQAFQFLQPRVMFNLMFLEKLISLGQLYLSQNQQRNYTNYRLNQQIDTLLSFLHEKVQQEVLNFNRLA